MSGDTDMLAKKLLLPAFLVMTACAVGFSSVRNSGAVIQENPSARAAAMVNAYSANTVDDAFGIFSNPSYFPSAPVAALAYSSVFKSGKNISEESFSAFSFLYPELCHGINIGAAFVSSLEGNAGNGQDSVLCLNVSGKIEFLSVGANVKYVDSGFFRSNDSDIITADAGMSASFGIFTLGLSAQNLFGDFKDVYGKKVNPSLSGAASCDFNKGEFIFSLSAGCRRKDFGGGKINPQGGFEIFYRFAALRCGYEYDGDLKDKGFFCAGLGMETKNIIFDYAFIGAQNDSETGDRHKVSAAYRFYAIPKVDNELYMQQIKYEKQQAKLEKQKRKQMKKEEKIRQKRQVGPPQPKKAYKDEMFSLQTAKVNEYGHEFEAVLSPEEIKPSPSKETSLKKKEKLFVRVEDKEFDAAKYILKNPGKHKVKQYFYAPTKVDENDFDAARYILENPGHSKIKEYYFKPTKVSEDDFDAALYLLKTERETNSVPR